MDWLEYENKNIARGFLNICGVDEAGRGPLAGPVCAAAVILPENTVIEGVNDSKSFLKKERGFVRCNKGTGRGIQHCICKR